MKYFKTFTLFTKIKSRIFLLILAVCWIPTELVLAVEPVATNKQYKLATAVADEYLRSFATQVEEQEENIADKIANTTLAHDIRPPKLDAVAVRKLIFNSILAQSGKLSTVQQAMEPILNEYAWGDLKLFYGTTTRPDFNLISRINHTTTLLGEAVLATLLVTPTSNIETLQERQQILKLLLNNPSLIKALKIQLKTYQDAEQSMLSLWTTRDPLYSKDYVNYMEDKFYVKGSAASNKSTEWLEFKKRLFRDFGSIQIEFLWPLVLVGGLELFTWGADQGLKDYLHREAHPTFFPYYNYYHVLQKSSEKFKVSKLIWPTFMTTFHTWRWSIGIKNYLEYSSVLRNLALRMADLQFFVLAAGQVSQIIATIPALEEKYGKNLTAVRELLAQSKENTELSRLIGYLQKLPFKDWSYFFNNAGKLLAAHKLFVEHKDAFADAMYEIGLLDSYVSFATLMQEATNHHSEHAYVFAQFLDRTQKPKPYIKIEDMWNPFLDSKKAIGNNLEMDASAAGGIRTMVLTGPNAGGKSTFLTGVTHTLLLAHVMGIGPARKIVLTPFNRINTYIDIADDIAAGKSLFMAEVDRSQKHIHMLKNLKPDEFSFTVFDEPFSGTNPIEGAAAEYSILESLADFTNSFTMVATHYPLVMLLEEKASNKGFANYKVYITRQGASGKLNYTYKIVPGRSTQAIAIDILEEQGYDMKMLARAREIIKHPKRYQTKF